MQGSGADGKKPADTRNVYGPRALGALLPALTRPAFRKRNPATAAILAEWENVVGTAIGGVSIPRRLSAGTLTIGCSGPIAMELQHLSAALRERINRHFGQDLVQRLRFVQEAPPVIARLPAQPTPPPGLDAAVEARLADMPPGPLRDALAALGRAVFTERGVPQPRSGGTRPDPEPHGGTRPDSESDG